MIACSSGLNHHDCEDRSDKMTTPTERLDPPGGVAMLAGRPVARIGFGAMQLPGPGVSGPPPDRDTALAVLRQAVELGVNHIADHPDAAAGTNIAFDNQLAEMVSLRDEGKIGGIGISNVTLDQLRQALPGGIACVQNGYSLLDRSGEPLLELCRLHDLAWVPYFPLGSAFPGVPKVTEHPAIVAAAKALGATPAQVGLAWLLAHSPQVLLIPGTSNLNHLAENVDAGQFSLDARTTAVLNELSSTPR
jgi:aryl-alcohol dehydrogenase-like predicted oxidoreductase